MDKAVRIVELLDEHGTIKSFVNGRPVRITLHVRTTETPADVRDLGDAGVEINLASYYFEKYDIGYIMGMLSHEIGLHPLASSNSKIPEEEELYQGMPLLVPGLETLSTPRFMNTEGAGQADHVMAAFPHTIRHGIYRDIVLEMAEVLAQHARVGVAGAKPKDVTDLIDTYLMDLASIAVTNDHRARAVRDPAYTARVYNAYKSQFAEQLADDSPVRALLPGDKGRFGVLGDFAALATSVGTNNRGDSIQRPVAPEPAVESAPGVNPGEARPRLPQSDTDATPAPTSATTPATAVEPTLTPFKSGNFEFTNLKHTNEGYRDKAVRIIELLRKHDTIRTYVGGRPVRITLHLRTTETPADVTDRGDAGVDINLASYYFEKYDIGYIMGMLAHEIGLHPLASRDTNIPDEESMFAGVPLAVPGLTDLKTPRTMSTEGAGQADHIMAAFPSSTRHKIYRDIVLGMASDLAEEARTGEEGAKAKDVTDLIDTYLMDLATIALTNDKRKDAAWEPRYTAKVYNAYKEQFAAQLAQDSPVRSLLPADKSWYNVTSNFLGLGSSVAFNNQGDSIQTATPAPSTTDTGETPPRLTGTGTHAAPHTGPAGSPRPGRARDKRPRFVVRSGFDARRFTYDGDPVTDLTVRIAMRGGTDGQNAHAHANVFAQLSEGVHEFLNNPGHRLPNGDLLHVTVELVDPSQSPHLTVDLTGRDQVMDQKTWWADAAPIQLVHELTHQLGLRDEYRDADAPHRPHILGSLLGDLNAAPEDSSLAAGGLRGRHLALLGALIGDVTPRPSEQGAQQDTEQTWQKVREDAKKVLREAIWVDPVSLPKPTDGTENTASTGVPAHMLQNANTTPDTAAAPAPGPFVMENFEFTNLKSSDERYRTKATRVIELLRDHPRISAYVSGRPVRITLHVRTTEPPADVRDLGDDGVQINLASYYFEKYDIGYVMGMLAHEIGLHPLASRDTNIPDEEEMFAGVPLAVPGLSDLTPPRTMNTVGSGQADHIMAAYPSSTRHGIYRDIVVKMAEMMAEFAQAQVPGAKLQDATDLMDSYLMDLASIAITSDHRLRAATEPGNTAKVYNEYKRLLAAHMAANSPARALLPADKGMFGVVRNFATLTASVVTNNRGDSIQPPAPTPTLASPPTDEARPRLPQAADNAQQAEESIDQAPVTTPQLRGSRDSRPRFVVRSGFDARRFTYDGDSVTDLTVRIAMRGAADQTPRVFGQLSAGVSEFLNHPGHRLPNGDLLHVTVELVDPSESPHLTVDLAGRDQAMDQVTWWADADPIQLVHELTHQLGLRDEYRDADSQHRPHILGSLLGDLNAAPEDSSLAAGGLRGRHLALLGALIGDVTPRPTEQGAQEDTEQTWDKVRENATKVRREAVWVDPVSLPRSADGTTATDVPARTPQDPTAAPTAPEPVLRPFKLGNFEFTNLNQTDRYVDKAVRIVELLDEHGTIKSFVSGRPVRITLHVRTTETPADVRDLGDAGVEINLASYYFEKYDIGYIMGMLSHEIGLHPLASSNTKIPEEEELYQGMPLLVPGLETLSTPRFMNTEGAGQADHVMAAFPHTIRHGIYRDIVVEMAEVLAQHARVGVAGAKSKDVTDLIDTYLMDLASIAVTNDHRARAVRDPAYTARVYNAYKGQFAQQLADDSPVRALLPGDKGRFGVLGDFAALATSVGTNNRGDSIQRPVAPEPAAESTPGANPGEARPRLPQSDTDATPAPTPATVTAVEPVLTAFKLGNFEFTNLNQTDRYVDKAVRIVELLDEHGTIKSFVNGRPVRITLHVRTTETPADVRDLGDAGVEINLASYYFEKYDIGYIMGMLSHEIGLHPLASSNSKIPEEEELYQGMPLLVPGLETLSTPRFMNTEGAGQADHVMAAFPHTIRHGIYRDIVLEMAEVLAQHARVGVAGAKSKDVTDLIDTYLMDLASIAVTNDHRARAMRDPAYTARVYNAYKSQFAEQLADDSPVRALLPGEKGRFGVLGDFAALATRVGTNNSGDSIQRPVAPEPTVEPAAEPTPGANPGEARPRLPQSDTDTDTGTGATTAPTPATAVEPTLTPFKSGNFEFTNLKHTNEAYRDKAVRIIELLRKHDTIRSYVNGRPVRITLHLRTTETPADVTDRGDAGVDINLASYYFEKYDIGYVMGMLAHEIGLHPLASQDTNIPDEESMFAGVPLTVPGLAHLTPPRTMNTVGSGQADHIMAAFPSSTRHKIYRNIVLGMANDLAEEARTGEEGAKAKDVTDLIDTYLMDLATIALTNDKRKDAAWEPRYTAKVYNAYKEQFAAQLAQDSPVRSLLPADKSWYNVTSNFLGLGSSVAFNNQGDSIQTATPAPSNTETGETRPRLSPGDTKSESGSRSGPSDTTSAKGPRPSRPRDKRPRFVVRSDFDARRFTYDSDPVTDLTVRIAMRGGTDGQNVHANVFAQLSEGVHEFLNNPGHRLPNGDLLHVTVELVDPSQSPHLTVDLVGRDQAMDQVTWWADADPIQLVHELTHQLGLRDEYRDADAPHRPHILGSLLGDLNAAPEDSSLAAGGLRGRHLALMGALIGDVTPGTSEQGAQEDTEQTWRKVREDATKVRREAIWVDPVSLPQPSTSATGDTAVTDVPARTLQDSNAAPTAPEPVLRPFKLGNFEFTNLNQTDRYVDKAVRIVELLDEHGTIKSFVNGRPVRITLHVRTTETPADVRDLGDAGVEINLASYYFEKYDIGYIMGMLSHEIGLHPLASSNSKIPEEEELYQGMPLLVPGLETLSTPRFMNTEGAGQADHVMAAFPHTIRHGIYRDIVVEMAEVLAQHARVGVAGAKPKDVTDLIDTYLMDLASIAVTNDHRARAVRDPAYTARVYNAYKSQFAQQLADDSPVRALLPGDKGRFGVLGDFAALATSVGTNNRGDSIQRPVAPEPTAEPTVESTPGANPGEARPRLPQSDTGTNTGTGETPTSTPAPTPATPTEPTLTPFRSGKFEFTNLKHTEEKYRDKAVRIIELLREHPAISAYVGDRPVRITLHVRTTETPADVRDLGDAGVQINLASYYFEKYDIGYIMGMLAHEIGLHPLASRNGDIPDEESMFRGIPLPVPGLGDLRTPRTMNTDSAGQADHIMAAFPSSTRHGIYRDIVLKMADMLAEAAQAGVEGAKAKDVTDLIDTYLMDLASIAITSDYRMNAAKEPGNTAKVYNAYKALFAARMAADSPARGLLPADKGMFGVVRDFATLAANLATNNRGDSIQQPLPTGEARPRLPQVTDTRQVTDTAQGISESIEQALAGTPKMVGPRDSRPRFVVRSGFDARRLSYQGEQVTDLTVRIRMRGTDAEAAHAFEQLSAGVHEFLNEPGHRLPNGDLLHVTVELVDASESPHLSVDLTGRDQAMDQVTWWADADPVQMVHELTHQLGLRDEYRDADSPHRPHIAGSLLGDLNAAPEDSSLAAGGLRGRHLALLGALVGDVPSEPERTQPGEPDIAQTWDEARKGVDGILREAVWVDPVSLPRPADGTDHADGTEVPARMQQDPNTAAGQAAVQPAPLYAPFSSGNFEFTNLKHTNEAYRDKAVRIIDLLRKHDTIKEYVGDRRVRVTLHVRTTETPADVTDRGDAGVDINLASYYFEKYGIGHIMGMLAHEIGLHPLASRNRDIPDEEEMFQDVPLAVPGLGDLATPRTMSTVGAGQADHIMAAYPSSTRHRIYRDIVLKMAGVLAEDARLGEDGARAQDVTDLIDCYLMDLASIALTNDYRMNAAKEPNYTARVYNAYKEMLLARLPNDAAVRALLPSDKSMFGVMNDFRRIGQYIAIGNSGDSIQRADTT
ncbi:hypothetical protein [Streptomyces sp. NPDC127119]|uniref:hypothetical protein n=1 Tax=Streptomyces sp. NPDC127119 TaxID=3345370 RepID=UPI00362FD30F